MGERAGRVVHATKDPFEVYVGRGRGSAWGNPFRIGDPHPETGEKIRRDDAISLFKEWIVRGVPGYGDGRHLLSRLGELEGKTLACWCAPKGGVTEHDPLVCHAQILLKLVSWRRKKIVERREARGGGRRGGGEGGRSAGFRTPKRRAVFCGSRGWTDAEPIREALSALPEGTVVVAGARGADRIAEREARAMGFAVEVHPARWDEEDRGAGYRRNERMVNLPGVESVHAFRRGEVSSGTDHTVGISRKAGIPNAVVSRP